MKVICIYSSEYKNYSSPVFTDTCENGCKFILNNIKDTFNVIKDKALKEDSNEFTKSLPSLFHEKLSKSSIYLVGEFDEKTGEFTNDKQLLVDKLSEVLNND